MNQFGQAVGGQNIVAQAQAAAQGVLGAAGAGQVGLQVGQAGLGAGLGLGAGGLAGLGKGQTGFFGAPFFGRIQCLFGRVNLFRFIRPPAPGTIIGQLNTQFGLTIPLIQTQTTVPPLSAVDGQFAILCGFFTIRQNQVVFNVLAVFSLTPTVTPLTAQQQAQATT